MPKSARRGCKKWGCTSLSVRGGGGYCANHQPQETKYMYDRHRPSAAKRGYDRRWQTIRQMVLNREPLCRDPHGIHQRAGRVVEAVDVHHITPLSENGTHEIGNLMPLCHACHSMITASAQGKGV